MGLKKNNPGCNCCECTKQCAVQCQGGESTCYILVALPAIGSGNCQCNEISEWAGLVEWVGECEYVRVMSLDDTVCGSMDWKVSVYVRVETSPDTRTLWVELKKQGVGEYWQWRLLENVGTRWDCSDGTTYTLPSYVGQLWSDCADPVDDATITFGEGA